MCAVHWDFLAIIHTLRKDEVSNSWERWLRLISSLIIISWCFLVLFGDGLNNQLYFFAPLPTYTFFMVGKKANRFHIFNVFTSTVVNQYLISFWIFFVFRNLSVLIFFRTQIPTSKLWLSVMCPGCCSASAMWILISNIMMLLPNKVL